MNDLKQFEDRNDDWLAKQRRLEQRISPWDLDEARRIKEEHEIRHRQYNQRRSEYQKERNSRPNVSSSSGNKFAKVIVIAVILVLLMTLLPLLLMAFRGHGVISFNFLPIFFFLIVIILSSLGGKKR